MQPPSLIAKLLFQMETLKTIKQLSNNSPFLFPPETLEIFNLLSVSMDLAILNISCKWNPTIFVLLFLAYII